MLIVLLLLYPTYKGLRELFWVRHNSFLLNKTLKFEVRIDTDIIGFQDFESEKTIRLTNLETKSKLKISYASLEESFYVYLDTISSSRVIKIVDKFAGQNTYDLLSLKLVGTEDCLKDFGGCGGFNDSSFKKLGTPDLTFDNTGFHN